MKREDFGDWSEQLDDRTFWQAVALLGILGGHGLGAPRNARQAEAVLESLYLSLLASERPGPLWDVTDELQERARSGDLVEARWLADRWNALRKNLRHVRMHCPFGAIYDDQHQIGMALREHAGATLHVSLPTLTPAEDWQWPLRIALSRSDGQEKLWDRLQDWCIQSTVVRQLVRFSRADREPVAEFLVLSGMPVEALQEVESFPTPIRAHCLILLPAGEIVLDQDQMHALFRLQQLTLAKGVLIASLRDAEPSRWMVDLFYQLAHNLPIDQAVAGIAMPLPLMFLDPALFRIARVGIFAEKIATALENAGETLLDIGPEAARGISLGAGRYPAMEVADRLRSALRDPDAFDEERRGSTWSIEILKAARKDYALQEAHLVSRTVHEAPPERRLQMDVLDEDGRATEHFHAAGLFHLVAWIGQREGALSGAARFPEELLPGEESGHLLTITFFAPEHTEQPIVQTVYLPRAGESTSCRLSFRTNAEVPRVEARITIAYLNRVLQTYLLTGGPDDAIALTPEMATEADWQGLGFQRPYGATIVLNRMQGRRTAMVQAGYKALAFSLEGLNDAMTEMESELDASKWDSPDFQGLKAKGSGELVLYLAKHGFYLLDAMKQYAPAGKAGQAFLANLLNADPVQVLAANLGARLPVELFYANPYPKDDAKLCPTYDAEPGRTGCGGCPNVNSDHYCPLGFWSLRKVIEWYDFEAAKLRQKDFAPRDFAVQAADKELQRDRLGEVKQVLVGVSSKAGQVEPKSVENLIRRIEKAGLDPVVATDWEDWTAKVQANRYRLLVLVPHTLKNNFNEECLEICGKSLASGLIDETYVAAGRRPGPIVLLIGCNTENLGIPFRNFAVRFMTRGSAIVVSTITQVLGRHASPLAAELVEAIAEAQADEHATFGSLMRDVRRKWLRSELPPISLGLKCYGDARWRF
jgi:hypothetical protein